MSLRVIQTVNEVVQRGVHVVLASARPPRTVREIYKHLSLDSLQVNYNGALIFDSSRHRHVFHQPLAPDLTRKVIKLARKIDPQVVVSLEILDKWYTDHVDEQLPTETSRTFAPDFVGPLESFWHVPVTKLMLLAPAERLQKITAGIQAKFARKVSLLVSDSHLLQVVHPEVDKWRGLAWIANQLNIDATRVMAVGDAPNDIGMLRWAGLGVAVENAWDQVRAVADVVVPSNDEDGVAFALRRYVLDR
jgi:Cof subfamily protein (haloacid dehalogenase superfamily)